METAASFVGVGLEGCLVPLKSGMPTLTNNGFVIGDLNVLTGLLGDTSSSLNTGWSPTSSQDDFSVSIYCTGTPTTGYVYGSASGSGASNQIIDGRIRNQNNTQDQPSTAVTTGSLSGATRAASTGFDWRIAGSSGSFTRTSETPSVRNLFIFSRTLDGADTAHTPCDARIATYHAGAALNLATLESLQI
jgi:hypothetical protein